MLNFEKVCRTCAKENNNLVPLFENKKIPRTLMEITNLHITENDGFPSNLCPECIDKINAVITFRHQCEEAHNKLLSCYQIKIEIKEEKVQNNENINDNNEAHFRLEDDPVDNTDSKTDSETESSKNVDKDELINQTGILKKVKRTRNNNYGSKKRIFKKAGASIICTICNKKLARRSFKDHMNSHMNKKPFKCEVCSIEFTWKSNYRRHLSIHSNEKHPCSTCGKLFSQRRTLRQHIRTHEAGGVKITKRSLAIQKANAEKPFLCNVCGKSFSFKYYLEQHLRVHTGERPFKCTFCEKSFKTVATLSGHVRIHTGERPFACDLCNKTFTQKPHLKYHLAMHKGEKRYQCTYCDKKYASNQTLQLHLRVHTGEKPFVCSVCHRSFYDARTLKKHKH